MPTPSTGRPQTTLAEREADRTAPVDGGVVRSQTEREARVPGHRT